MNLTVKTLSNLDVNSRGGWMDGNLLSQYFFADAPLVKIVIRVMPCCQRSPEGLKRCLTNMTSTVKFGWIYIIYYFSLKFNVCVPQTEYVQDRQRWKTSSSNWELIRSIQTRAGANFHTSNSKPSSAHMSKEVAYKAASWVINWWLFGIF